MVQAFPSGAYTLHRTNGSLLKMHMHRSRLKRFYIHDTPAPDAMVHWLEFYQNIDTLGRTLIFLTRFTGLKIAHCQSL